MSSPIRRVSRRPKQLAVRVSPAELARLHAAARRGGITLADLVREGSRLLAREIEQQPEARS